MKWYEIIIFLYIFGWLWISLYTQASIGLYWPFCAYDIFIVFALFSDICKILLIVFHCTCCLLMCTVCSVVICVICCIGGHFVCKLFDIFTWFSVGLVYLMYRAFEHVAIFKPVTSRPANSERCAISLCFCIYLLHYRDNVVTPSREL